MLFHPNLYFTFSHFAFIALEVPQTPKRQSIRNHEFAMPMKLNLSTICEFNLIHVTSLLLFMYCCNILLHLCTSLMMYRSEKHGFSTQKKNSNTSIASKQQIEHKFHSATELFQFVLRCIFYWCKFKIEYR